MHDGVRLRTPGLSRESGIPMTRPPVTFVNGVFDVLHVGHVRLLRFAASLDLTARVIVGLNEDESVRRLKGPGRPITPWAERAEILLALSFVDSVAPFAEDDPVALLTAMHEAGDAPSLVIKGGDYRNRIYPELALLRRIGSKIVYFDRTSHSTSALLCATHGLVACDCDGRLSR